MLCLLLLWTPVVVLAQGKWTMEISGSTGKYEQPKSYMSKAEAQVALNRLYATLLSDGYLDASLDTIWSAEKLNVQITPGQRYFLRTVSWRGDSLPSRYQTPTTKKKLPWQAEALETKAENALTNFENNGYPFASVAVNRLQIDSAGMCDVEFQLKPGPRVMLDSLIIKSETKMPERYIRNYLQLQRKSPYNESQFVGIEKKIREIPFVQTIRPPEVLFKPGEADLFVYLKRKKANYFNGILGIRPDDVTGKVNLTGDAEVRLLNALNTGEELYLNWRKMQAQTQDLTIKANLPFLFNLPFGVDGSLKIYKRDTTFSQVKTGLGLVLFLGGRNRLKAFVERNEVSQLSSFVTAQPLGNVSGSLYGLNLYIEKLDYVLNPRKGYTLMVEAGAGNRSVSSSNRPDAAQGRTSREQQYRLELKTEKYLPTAKKQCVKLAANSAYIIANGLYDNELYRFGGLRTMRGLDEESIFASAFVVGSLEYRLLFEENSALYLFYDQGWYEKTGLSGFVTDTPRSFGAGVNFEVKAGIFTFNYALGRQFDNPILVRNAKVSFGFISIF